jgi:hypothetical protein
LSGGGDGWATVAAAWRTGGFFARAGVSVFTYDLTAGTEAATGARSWCHSAQPAIAIAVSTAMQRPAMPARFDA